MQCQVTGRGLAVDAKLSTVDSYSVGQSSVQCVGGTAPNALAGQEARMSQGRVTHITSEAERARRYSALRAAMEQQGIDALVISSRGDEFVRGRVQYVSDIFQWAGWGFVVLPMAGDAVFIVDPLQGTGYATMGGWLDDYRTTQDPGAEVGRILGDLGMSAGTIGIVGLADITAVAHHEQLKSALPGASLRDATDLFDDVRAIKSDEEVENIRETGRILRTVFQALEAEIRPGVREVDVLAQAHRLARQLGCVEGIALMGRPLSERSTSAPTA